MKQTQAFGGGGTGRGQKKGGSGVEMASLVRSGRYTWPVLILFGILTKHSRYATSALPWGWE